ncbi:zinc finger CCCH domain-containing protein 1 [Phtheirospermum japonicum]|uniref:Zinc finger CCCH domain-containing protein 1 n=1 Tax=Phtheirospermum japonicum TaxID=374723 RepID=A0A830CCJ1_9LAMI|nr:zinc finger CCCH domain-containing protein 1 [Phtheirospermum japonicum]
MHDRGDYKLGWQIEKEWDEKEKARLRKMSKEDGRGDDDERGADISDDNALPLPFACFICREPFVDPVMTRCKHYFCKHCALKHHAKNKKCFVCDHPTNGIFNIAFEIRHKPSETRKD